MRRVHQWLPLSPLSDPLVHTTHYALCVLLLYVQTAAAAAVDAQMKKDRRLSLFPQFRVST